MNEDFLMSLARECLLLTLQLAAPMLLFGLVVGVATSILQAVTQIQESSLSFIPKALAVGIAFLIFMPWMLQKLMGFTRLLFGDFASLTR